MAEPIALLIADLHLCHNVPAARSAEPDWYRAMGRVLDELREIHAAFGVPVFCAGDVFDRWNSPPQLVNFAIDRLAWSRGIFSVPGQHDLPYHSLDRLSGSAYGTLERAAVLEPPDPELLDGLSLTGVPWGQDIPPAPEVDGLKVLLAHRYVWTGDFRHPKAAAGQHVSVLQQKLRGYDVAVFGDNHAHFSVKVGDCLVWNCGCLIRRTIAERQYKPVVGLLKSDGTVERIELDTEYERWIEEQEAVEKEGDVDVDGFLAELESLGRDSLDFRAAMNKYLQAHDVANPVRKVILEVMEDGQ